MKHETNRRIKEYTNRLPRLKERLLTTTILLLVGVIMLTTVSFSWLTLSKSPETTNILTSIASNGNLEIALASGSRYTITAPGASQVGDGNLPIVSGNLTWGNMVNLSDPSYGLSNLVLRPAGLNVDNLLNEPLKAKGYDEAGRPINKDTPFRYAKWISTNPDDEEAPWEFQLTDELGVRAISSTKMAESSGYAYTLQVKLSEVKNANSAAETAYLNITKNIDIDGTEKQFLEALATVMGAYMTANMNATQENNESLINATMDKASMEAFRDLFAAFIKVLELEQESMRQLANLQLFVINGGDTSKYTEFATVDALVAQKDKLKSMGLQISGLAENLSDYEKLKTNYEKLITICEQGTIKWGDDNLSDIVNALINVGTCTVNGTRVSSIGASAALDLNNKSCATIITNGVLYNFEKRTGARMDVPKGSTDLEQKYPKGLTVKAKGKRLGMTMTGTIYALITTNAPTPSLLQQDLDYTDSKNTGGTVALTANDTYGFAIDFWVRTNASGSFLTLEGNIITETVEEDAKGLDAEGNEVQLYTVTLSTTDESGEAVDYTVDVYMIADENGAETWYYAETHEVYEKDASNPPKKKVNIIETVVGYEGENRIWDNNAFLSTDNTTQGSGSCYVYYAETPEDMARSLKLLSAMNIAFVDQKGTLLAEGYMDTVNYFVDNGKVIVPLRLNANSITLQNSDGSETLAITPLEQNVATLVSAIVYLDGTKVENKDVLAVSDIQGQLNIQFGSSVALNAISDEELASKSMSVSASADVVSFDYDTCLATGTPMTTKLTVKVDGSKANNVKAFFIRAISSTQGIPMNSEKDMLVFEDKGNGQWEASYTFTSPGKYVLRSVQVDGIEYDLEPDERPQIEVKGFSLKSLSWESTTAKEQNFMTAANAVSAGVSLEFVTNDPERMPTRVEGRFLRTDGNSVNVTFTRNVTTNKWTGKASFLSSGTYTLQYLVFNGEYHEVDLSLQKVANVYVGMKVSVHTQSPNSFLFGYGVDGDADNGMEDNEENLYMQVKIMDDTGKEMTGLSDVKLYYAMEGYTTVETGLNADITWNQSSGYYEGAFKSKVGVFKFLYVTVDGNTITNATTSPRFVIQSPTPPSFNLGNTTEFQYKPNNDAAFSLLLNDSDGITQESIIGYAYFGTDETTLYKVEVAKKEGDQWNFKVPQKDGSQDGTWTLKELHVIAGYIDGAVRDEENPYVIDLTGKTNLSTTVLSTIKVELDKTDNIDLSGEFLQEHTINSLGINIKDKSGNALPGIANTVTLVYSHQDDSRSMGGYDITTTVSNEYTITLTNTGNGIHFNQTTGVVLKHAGTYKLTSINYSFDGGVVTLSGNSLPKAPVITIESTAPSVSITGRSNDGSSTNTATSATVYYGESESCAGTNYSHPHVTITLTGMGKAEDATLTFTTTDNNGSVYLCKTNLSNNTSDTDSFTWTKDGTCQRWVGRWNSKTGDDGKTPAGTLTAKELVLTANGVTYTVSLTTPITIINPS